MSAKKKKNKIITVIAVVVLVLVLGGLISRCNQKKENGTPKPSATVSSSVQTGGPSGGLFCPGAEGVLGTVPAYSGKPYVELNNNIPDFSEDMYSTYSYEFYSELDELGRCGYTIAVVGLDIMPTGKRESISSVKPTGWRQNFYDFVDGNSLYNRCHLIGYQLTGENANECNLITGTRYMNTEGMIALENSIADYVHDSGNHVLYRVTPLFYKDNLLAHGVHMEARSVEDGGNAVCFNVFAYNVQPGVELDYATGENWLSGEKPVATASASASAAAKKTSKNTASPLPANTPSGGNPSDATKTEYVLNTSSKKYHLPDCNSVPSINEKNKETRVCTKDELEAEGYKPCGACKP